MLPLSSSKKETEELNVGKITGDPNSGYDDTDENAKKSVTLRNTNTITKSIFSLYFYPQEEIKVFLDKTKERLEKIKINKPHIVYEVGLSDKLMTTSMYEETEENGEQTTDDEGIYGFIKRYFISPIFDKKLNERFNGEDNEEEEEDYEENIETLLEKWDKPICIYIVIKGVNIVTIGGVRELENTLDQLEFFL